MTYQGFKYLRKTYIWKDGDLYRLPFVSHLRHFGLKKITPKNGFFVLGNGVRKSLSQVIGMTVEIESDFVFPKIKTLSK